MLKTDHITIKNIRNKIKSLYLFYFSRMTLKRENEPLSVPPCKPIYDLQL